jgi:hypothetical protein
LAFSQVAVPRPLGTMYELGRGMQSEIFLDIRGAASIVEAQQELGMECGMTLQGEVELCVDITITPGVGY